MSSPEVLSPHVPAFESQGRLCASASFLSSAHARSLARELLVRWGVNLRTTILSIITFAAILGACTDSTTTPPVDAAADSSAARTCKGVAYDPCSNDDQCMSGNCHLFNDLGVSVCTVACTATAPCAPDANGNQPKCNMMGTCKPTVKNSCVP